MPDPDEQMSPSNRTRTYHEADQLIRDENHTHKVGHREKVDDGSTQLVSLPCRFWLFAGPTSHVISPDAIISFLLIFIRKWELVDLAG